MKRLFLGLPVPDYLGNALAGLDPGIEGVRWLEATQFHLTLAFLGAVGPEEQALLEEKLGAVEVGRFFLPLRGLGTFPAKGEPRVVWVGVGAGHPHLFQLHKRVNEAVLAAGLEADLRPWHPHVTLARCDRAPRGPVQKFVREHADFEAGLMKAESFALFSSRPGPAGSIYTVEMEFALR